MRDLIRHILREELILEMSKKLNTEDFINKAKEVHGDKYDYTPTNYVNSRTKVEINCPKHGIFEIRANDHIQGRGCKKCGIENQTKPIDKVIQQFEETHGDFYDYSQVDYKQTDTKVKIICPIHGEFEQKPIIHIKGQGCPKCGFEKGQGANRRRANEFKTEFIDNAEKVHGKLYDYSEVNIENANTKVKIICPIHGEFEQRAINHLRGIGCPNCGFDRVRDSKKIPKEEMIRKANEVHGNKYDYSQVEYDTVVDKVNIICPKHGVFSQRFADHINQKHGCPICNESKGVKTISNILKKYNIPYIREKKFLDCVNISGEGRRYCRQLPFDVYIPSQNTLIEYDGIQHFQPVTMFGGEEQFEKQQRLDQIKNNYCRDNGIKLIRIPYTIKDEDIETLLKDESVI